MNPKTIYEKDSDQDGLTDGQELALGIDPQSVDTDGDGQADLEELQSGHSPNFKLKLATHKKFTRRLVVQAFFRVIVNPIFDKSDFFRGRFLGSFW